MQTQSVKWTYLEPLEFRYETSLRKIKEKRQNRSIWTNKTEIREVTVTKEFVETEQSLWKRINAKVEALAAEIYQVETLIIILDPYQQYLDVNKYLYTGTDVNNSLNGRITGYRIFMKVKSLEAS